MQDGKFKGFFCMKEVGVIHIVFASLDLGGIGECFWTFELLFVWSWCWVLKVREMKSRLLPGQYMKCFGTSKLKGNQETIVYKVRRSQMAVRFSWFWLFRPTFYNVFVFFFSATYLRRLFSCHWNSLKTSSTRGVESLLDSFLATQWTC